MSAYKFKNILSSDISFNFSKTVKHVANLNSSALTALICALYQDNDVPLLVICADSVDAHTLLRTLKAIVKRDDIYFFRTGKHFLMTQSLRIRILFLQD